MSTTTSTALKLVLPTESTSGEQEWRSTRITIIGAHGIGKSGLFANGERTFFIDCEGQLGHLKTKRLPCRSIDEFAAIDAALKEMAAAGTYPYDTVVIDTLDMLVERMEDRVVDWARGDKRFAHLGVNAISDIPKGAGYGELSKRVMSALNSLDALPSALVLITHPKTVKIEEPTGDYDKETISVFPSVAGKVLSWSHHVMHVQSKLVGQTFKRTVKTVPEKGTEGKSYGLLIPNNWEWSNDMHLIEEHKKLRALFK